MAVSDVNLSLGDGANPFLAITDASGFFVIKKPAGANPPAGSGGLAGTIRGTIALNVPGITLGGTLAVQINNLTEQVTQTFTVGGVETDHRPAGRPFLRVEGTDLALGVFGQTLSGDFAFEQITTTTAGQPEESLRISLANVELRLGDGTTDFVRVTEGTGYFLIMTTGAGATAKTGIAGQLGAKVALDIPASPSTRRSSCRSTRRRTRSPRRSSFRRPAAARKRSRSRSSPGRICASKRRTRS
jgi:hypothetical protein